MKRTALMLALTAALCFSGCASDEKKDDEIVIPIYKAENISYNTETAEIGEITQRYYIDGGFGYPYSEKVMFRTNGIISSLNVKSGSKVKKGDLLCTLDTEELDEALREKQVYIDQAQITLNKVLNDNDTTYNEAQLARTQLEVLQLEYDHMNESYEEYKVYAPCDGVFKADAGSSFSDNIAQQQSAQKIVTVGSAVERSQTLGFITDQSREFVTCDVYDVQLENVGFGTKVTLQQGGTEAQGKVIDVIHNDQGGMNYYTYVIETDDDSGLGDMDIRCVFDVYSKLDTVLVPTKAIKTAKDRTYVDLLIDGTKIEQDVETGIVDGKKTEIISGLSGGEQVIIN